MGSPPPLSHPLPAPQISVSFTTGAAVAPHGTAADALVIGCWDGGTIAAGAHRHGLDAWLGRVVKAQSAFTGKIGHVLPLHVPDGVPTDRLVLAGLGAYDGLDTESARRMGAEVGAALAGMGAESAAISLEMDASQAAAFALGLSLRLHRTPAYRGRPGPSARPLRAVVIHVADIAAAEAAWTVERARANGVAWARDLMAEPGGHLTPDAFATRVAALAALGVEVEILDEAALAKAGLNLHLAVGQASIHPPRLAVLRWRGGSDTKAPPTLLVGKGITFDTGGLCIKPASGMEEMKGDMGGAAAVAGTLRALAEAKAPTNVTGILALAENMPGHDSHRPGDVIKSHKGLTVEVVDTDAEGRMVLADALSWGCATEKPARVIDIATLTGSIVAALGSHTGGLFCRDDALGAALLSAGTETDEPLWRMPLSEFNDDDLDSPIADLRQCAPAGPLLPDALHAARFLSHFVPEGLPHGHLDIAGVAEADSPGAHRARGPVGFGVLLLTNFLYNI